MWSNAVAINTNYLLQRRLNSRYRSILPADIFGIKLNGDIETFSREIY